MKEVRSGIAVTCVCIAMLAGVFVSCDEENATIRQGGMRNIDSLQTETKKRILGPWWFDSNDPSARYLFLKDSLREVEHNELYPYTINGDSIAIEFGTGRETYRVVFPDSGLMEWSGSHGDRRLFRWDPNDLKSPIPDQIRIKTKELEVNGWKIVKDTITIENASQPDVIEFVRQLNHIGDSLLANSAPADSGATTMDIRFGGSELVYSGWWDVWVHNNFTTWTDVHAINVRMGTGKAVMLNDIARAGIEDRVARVLLSRYPALQSVSIRREDLEDRFVIEGSHVRYFVQVLSNKVEQVLLPIENELR